MAIRKAPRSSAGESPFPRTLVPRTVDRDNLNAQNLNAKAMLRRFGSDATWTTTFSRNPDPALAALPNIELIRLWPSRFWSWRLFLLYQQRADAIFYPGVMKVDADGLAWRRRTGRRVPVIGTFEALGGNQERERQYSEWAGHPVYCHHIADEALYQAERVIDALDHIVAISPFLAKICARLYGNRVSYLPLGIDASVFHARQRREAGRPRVIGVGTFQDRKRPAFFLTLARAFPQAELVWFGEGENRAALIEEAQRRGYSNLSFPGAIRPEKLAEEFRNSTLFVLPSLSEGSPKVAQEAAACGLPIILFGFYEPPSVSHGQNGYLVWNDEECIERVRELVTDPDTARRMGACSALMAQQWNWDLVAPAWEQKVLEQIGAKR